MRNRPVIGVALTATFLCIAGCIEIHEEYRLNGDGSGVLSIRVGLGKQFLALAAMGDNPTDPVVELRKQFEAQRADIEADPNVKSFTFMDEQKEEMSYVTARFELHDMTQAQQTLERFSSALEESNSKSDDEDADSEPGDDNGFPTELSIDRSDGALQFARLITARATTSDGDSDDNTVQLDLSEVLKAAFAGKYYTVHLHAPHVTDTNGTRHPDGYIEWKRSMVELMDAKEPWEITATVQAGASQTWLPVAAGVLGAVVVLVIVVVMAKRRGATTGTSPAE